MLPVTVNDIKTATTENATENSLEIQNSSCEYSHKQNNDKGWSILKRTNIFDIYE